jgi:hypothetical protein
VTAIAAYTGLRSSGQPLLDANGKVDDAVCEATARYPVVTLDINSVLLHPECALALRERNPEIRILGYLVLTHWWLSESFVPNANDHSFNARWHEAIKAGNGFLPDPVAGYEVDWANPDVTWRFNWLLRDAAKTRLFDGFFFDYCSPLVAWAKVGDVLTDAERMRAFCALVATLRKNAPEGFLLYGNGTGAEKLGLDGVMAEGFPSALTLFDKALTLKPGDWLKAEGSGSGDPRVARFTLGTARLTGATATYGMSRHGFDGDWWFPEYNIWWGEPLAPMEKVGRCWLRVYEGCTVVVNPTYEAQVVGSITVGPRDASFVEAD